MKAGRVVLLIGVGIIAVLVFTVSVWVIPRAAADTSPIASPEGAVGSLLTFTIANIFFGLAMLGAAFFTRGGVTGILVLAGIGACLFGLWMLDGAFSFLNHGPGMQPVAAVMFACVLADWVAGLLAFVGAVLLFRSRKREISSA
jgi:hypothetical protein